MPIRSTQSTTALVLALCSICSFAQTAETEEQKKQRLISNCFFVYAPMYEIAKKHDIPELRNYALPRLKYLQGYMEGRKDDKQFDAIFKSRLDDYKRDAEKMTKRFEQAIATGDKRLYNDQIQLGELCDAVLGIK